jgi:hypothetical protein
MVLSDAQWQRQSGLIISRSDKKGSTRRDNRMVIKGALWIEWAGAPW